MDFEEEYGVGGWTQTPPGSGSGTFDPTGLGYIAGGVGQIIKGFGTGSSTKAYTSVLRQNAADQLALAHSNAALQGQIAGVNAAAIRNVAKANAAAIERAAYRNGQLMVMEGAETMRREVKAARYLIGDIRARQAATGWNVNQGTLITYKRGQAAELEHQLEYSAIAKEMSLFTMLSNASDQAKVTLYAGEQQAAAIQKSAALANQIYLAEADAAYRAMMREAELYGKIGKANQYSQIFGGIGSIAGYAIGGPVGGMVGGAIGSTIGGIF